MYAFKILRYGRKFAVQREVQTLNSVWNGYFLKICPKSPKRYWDILNSNLSHIHPDWMYPYQFLSRRYFFKIIIQLRKRSRVKATKYFKRNRYTRYVNENKWFLFKMFVDTIQAVLLLWLFISRVKILHLEYSREYELCFFHKSQCEIISQKFIENLLIKKLIVPVNQNFDPEKGKCKKKSIKRENLTEKMTLKYHHP